MKSTIKHKSLILITFLPLILSMYPLNLVLLALLKSPFEFIKDIPLSDFTPKVALLVAITSARKVSELMALTQCLTNLLGI